MAKILLAEDDPFLVRAYEMMMKANKFDVVTVTDGKSALEHLISGKPDIAMLDVMMPEMTGIEVLKAAKANPEIAQIPILMLTNMSTTGSAEEAMKLGAAAYLVKSSLFPADVIKKVKEILSDSAKR